MSTAMQEKVVLANPLPETRADLEEFETTDIVLEVDVLWGDESLLHSTVVEANRSFTVGEGDARGHSDFLIAKRALGVTSLPLVIQHGGAPHLLVPREAKATLRLAGECERMLSAERGIAHSEPFGSHLHRLPEGAEAEVRYGEFVFRVRLSKGGRQIGKGFEIERAPLFYIAGAGVLLLLLIAAFAYLSPPSAGLNIGSLEQDTMLAEYLIEVEESKDDPIPQWMAGAMASSAGVEGVASAGDEGKLGDESAAKEPKRTAVKGPRDNPAPSLPPAIREAQARTAGILGALANLRLTTDGPTSPFAKQNAQGADAVAAMGGLLGDVGDTFGFNGLGLNGTGRHGGGTGEGTIGVGNHATIGGLGRGCDGPDPCTGGYDRVTSLGTGRASRVPKPRVGKITTTGSLSKEAIRRTVRRHLNEVRHCYESELRSRPDLSGRVAIKFVIAPSGAVQSALVAKSSVQDANVEECIAGAVRRWGFPEPEDGGIVAVTYPFMLSSR